MASNSNRLSHQIQSVVTKLSPTVQQFSKPLQRQQPSGQSQSHGLPWEMTALEAWDPKIVSYEDFINPNWTKEERLLFELKSDHFMVDAEDPWTQADVDAAWSRRNTPTAVSQPCPAFVLN